MQDIHFIVQGKGGVGKSFIAAVMAQFFNERKDKLLCFDTDPVNQTFSRYQALNVETIDILDEHNNIDSGKFDILMNTLLSEDGSAIIDNGAATFIPLMSYLKENAAVDMLKDSGAEVYFHIPLQGGQGLNDTLAGLVSILQSLPVKIVVWLNDHMGKILLDGQVEKIIQGNKDKIVSVIHIEERNPDTFGKDIKRMTENHLTIAEVMKSLDFQLMSKQRIKIFYNSIANQLSLMKLFQQNSEVAA